MKGFDIDINSKSNWKKRSVKKGNIILYKEEKDACKGVQVEW